jgi:SAM-dependent methyltransferase
LGEQLGDAMNHATWAKAWDYEVGFWRNWFQTKGLQWPDEYKARLDPARPLQAIVGSRLPVGTHRIDVGAIVGSRLPVGTHRILDVGAGPLTVLGKQWHGQPVHIVAVDPLAEAYDQLLADAHITPLVRTQQAFVETLGETFPANSFDIVHMMNALDHSRDPLTGILQMLGVVRPRGYVILSHATREATREHHTGMHQWDLFIEQDHFFLEGEGQRLDVSALLSQRQLAETTHSYGDDAWHWTVLRKRQPA